ncbi:MAG: TIGR00282 family metallophosphoesterase [Rhodobacteraceae bacterium]|nr:TIGR00282 family metallophosphoesterase [Paracoccaceae bacterium]
MRLLMLGDVMGRVGRDAVSAQVPELRRKLELDFVIVNAENATQGRGITSAHAKKLLECEIDCLTLGDHSFDQRGLLSDIDSEPRILRPMNFARAAPGKGAGIFSDAKGRKVLVMSALGRVFMQPPFDDPFPLVRQMMERHRLGGGVSASVLDFHAEATSEKTAMGQFCDGSLSLVAGTHTHIPTADHRILKGGTGYVTDLGMCGVYDSVIGMNPAEPLKRFLSGMRTGKLEPATGDPTICGVLVVTDDDTGLAVAIEPVRVGGALDPDGG